MHTAINTIARPPSRKEEEVACKCSVCYRSTMRKSLTSRGPTRNRSLSNAFQFLLSTSCNIQHGRMRVETVIRGSNSAESKECSWKFIRDGTQLIKVKIIWKLRLRCVHIFGNLPTHHHTTMTITITITMAR
jgi:hypothetical protein